MIDPLSLAVGAGLIAAGWLAGQINGRRTERHRRARPQEPVCGCGHHRALHAPKTLRCSVSVEVQLRDSNNRLAGTKWSPCACRQYVGPEPISSIYVPPPAIESGDR